MEITGKDDRLGSTVYACNSSTWEVKTWGYKASLDYMNSHLKRAEGAGRGVTMEEISTLRKECRHSKDEYVGKERMAFLFFFFPFPFFLFLRS